MDSTMRRPSALALLAAGVALAASTSLVAAPAAEAKTPTYPSVAIVVADGPGHTCCAMYAYSVRIGYTGPKYKAQPPRTGTCAQGRRYHLFSIKDGEIGRAHV